MSAETLWERYNLVRAQCGSPEPALTLDGLVRGVVEAAEKLGDGTTNISRQVENVIHATNKLETAVCVASVQLAAVAASGGN